KRFGQRDHAPGRGMPVEDAWDRPARFDQHEFSRATANVENHRRSYAVLEQDVAAQHGEPRLLLRADDVEHDARFAPHPFDEEFAVVGPATGFGCDRAREVDLALPELVGADSERRYRTV